MEVFCIQICIGMRNKAKRRWARPVVFASPQVTKILPFPGYFHLWYFLDLFPKTLLWVFWEKCLWQSLCIHHYNINHHHNRNCPV